MAASEAPRDGDPCQTVQPGTGLPCRCDFACDNYFLRARRRAGMGIPELIKDEEEYPWPQARRSFLHRVLRTRKGRNTHD